MARRFGLFELPGDYWFYMRDQPAAAAPPSHGDVRSRTAGWPAAIGRAVAATPADRLIPFSIHARPTPRRLGRGRVIRVGDAAQAMEPNLGQGACQAIEDALALGLVAGACQTDDMLAAFERMRRAACRRSCGARRRASTAPMAVWRSNGVCGRCCASLRRG